jgi:uncharacterized membrane protein
MNGYYLLKTLHVISATVLFGTGLGIAFFKWITDRSGSLAATRVISERVVLADWLFTLPAIVVQATTGFALARYLNYPLLRGWLAWSLVLFCVAGLCWIPVVWLQFRMRDLAQDAERTGAPLERKYESYAKAWFWLGVPAFFSLIFVFWLMVTKPSF